MVVTIARKEFLARLLTFRFFLASVLCVVVLPGVVYVRSWEYSRCAETHPKTVQSYRKRIAELPREFTWTTFQHPVARPLNPLSVLAEPVDLRDGGEAELYWLATPNYLRANVSNPIPELFPRFDALSFVTVVMSLLAIVFSFDTVCGEKERGTLKLMLANAVPRAQVLAGKWLGGLAALLLPFLIGVLVSALVALVMMSGSLATAHWLEMGSIVLLSALFISAVFTAGLLVSTLTVNAATSAALLLVIWALAFLVYPNLAPVAARGLAPMPGRREYGEVMARQWEPVGARLGALREEFEREWEPVKNDPAKKNDYWIRNREIYREEQLLANQALGATHEAVSRMLEKQVGVTAAILRATPMGSYVLAFDGLAGTGPTERGRLVTAIGRHHDVFFNYFANRSVEMVQRRKDEGLSDMPPYTAGDFPLFEYRETTFVQRLSKSLVDVVLLVAWNAVLFLASYARFIRYDVAY